MDSTQRGLNNRDFNTLLDSYADAFTSSEVIDSIQSGSHDAGATVERLERELEEQRDAAKSLRESLDAVAFQKEILEKSYAKQLGETREKLSALEAELKEKDEILANLGGGHEHTLRELNDALTVIKVLKQERDRLRKQIAEGGFRQPSKTSKALPLTA